MFVNFLKLNFFVIQTRDLCKYLIKLDIHQILLILGIIVCGLNCTTEYESKIYSICRFIRVIRCKYVLFNVELI